MRARGNIYFKAGLEELDLAIAELEIAVRDQPDAADANISLGLAYDNRGRLEDAERFYRKAIALDPDGLDGLDAHCNLALLLWMRGLGWAGLTDFPEWAASDRESPLVQAAFAEADKGIALGERVVLKHPGYLRSLIDQHRRYAEWCTQCMWGQRAIEHVEAILRLDPEDAEAREWLVKAGKNAGQKAQTSHTACIVMCELPSDLRRDDATNRVPLHKAAKYAGNPVVKRYDISNKKVILTMNPTPTALYRWDVEPELSIEVAEYTRETWSKLMNTIRQVGLQCFLDD
jgi:tetratricopeptide (TPR) repeat protein